MQMPETPPAERALEAPELITRAPRLDDLNAVVAIDNGWSHRRRREYLAERLALAASPVGIGLSRVALRGAEVVGFLFGQVTRGEYGRSGIVAWIDTVGVREDNARRGVGSLLITEFLEHARAAGADRVWTLLEPDTEPLTEFLQACDFKVSPVRVVERTLARSHTND